MKIIESIKEMGAKSKAQVSGVISGLVVGIVILFVGLFMISAVSIATALNSDSSFYTTQQALITSTGTIFSVLGLVIIVVALAVAIQSLSGVTRAAK